MTTPTEERLVRALDRALATLADSEPLPEEEGLRETLSELAWWLPEAFSRAPDALELPTLDGLVPAVARRLSAGRFEFLGVAWLIEDRALAPVHVRLEIDAQARAVVSFEGRFGETRDGALVREADGRVPGRLSLHRERLGAFPWRLEVRWGDRRGVGPWPVRPSAFVWPQAWEPVAPGSIEALNAELRREVGVGHVLHGLAGHAVGRARDNDDVLFVTGHPERPLAVVHMTWSGQPENPSSFPQTTTFADWQDFAEERIRLRD